MTIQQKQSTDIVVDEFRQILIWPLLLRKGDGSKVDMSSLAKLANNWSWAQQNDGKEAWRIGRDPWYSNDNDKDKSHCDYSEITYFHSFVRNFLYGGDGRPVKDHPIRVYKLRTKNNEKPPENKDKPIDEGGKQSKKEKPTQKNEQSASNQDGDSNTAEISIPDLLFVRIDTERFFYLHVARTEVYISESGVLMLVAEVFCNKKIEGPKKEESLKLSDAMDLQNLLRMVFPRRWSYNETTGGFTPKEAPYELAWADEVKSKDGEIEYVIRKEGKQDFRNDSEFTDVVVQQAELPVARHLRYLLAPFVPYRGKEEEKNQIVYKQIEDQRIPSMSFMAVEEPRQITDWDFARICFFDDPGESTASSYSDDFMKEWDRHYAYDRFWQRTPTPPIENLSNPSELLKHNTMHRTRWLCSGYGFSVVGSSKDPFYMSQIRSNFHHHYFRMGFIAHFHRASLLALREELSMAIDKKDAALHAAAIEIQKNSTRFRTRYWYHEVSTQLQGQEIFRWWSNRLGNQELFDRVTSDVEALASQVRTEIAEAESENIKLLTVFGLLAGFVGMIAGVISTVLTHILGDWTKVTNLGSLELIITFIALFVFSVVAVYFAMKGSLFNTNNGSSRIE